MADIVTDPDLIRSLNASADAGPPAGGTQQSGPVIITGDEASDLDALAAQQAKQPQATAPGKVGTVVPPALAPAAPEPAMAADQVPEYDAMGNPTGNLVDAPQASTMPYGQQMQKVGDAVGAAAGSALRGIPFSDRALAGAAAVASKAVDAAGGQGGASDYATNLAKLQAQGAQAQAAHPYLEAAGNFAGGALLPVGAVGDVIKGGGLLANIARGAVAGGTYGAAQGASSAPDLTQLGDVGNRALGGAGAGAVIGGALPFAGATIGKAYQTAAPFFAQPIEGMGRAATGILSSMIPPKTAATLSDLGPAGMLADASPSLTGLAGGVATRPGAGQDALVDALMGRQAGQAGRLAVDRDAALGPVTSPSAMAAALMAKSDAASPLLDQAYARGPLWNPDLADLSQRPAVAKALRTASDTAANAGNPLPTITLDEAGNAVSPSARAAYDAYAANAVPRTQQAIADLLGSGGTLATGDQIAAQRATAAGPLYDAFRASDIPTTPELAALLQRPSVKGALPAAERLANDEGTSIYVGGKGGGFEHDPLGSDTIPDEPPGFGSAPPPDGDLIPRPVKPDVPRPQTLVSFLQQAGGVRDPGGDLKSMGLDRFPGLVRTSGGLSPDMARQAAAQAGYLGPNTDEAMANTGINDLLDTLDRHPAYSVHDDDAVAAWETHDANRAAYDEQGRPQSRSAAPPRAPIAGVEDIDPDAAAPVRQITPSGWDYVKRALDDKIGTAQRGGSNNEARVWTGLKSELTAALDNASPDYASARQAYAGHSALSDALDAGGNAMKPATTREQVAREFADLGTDGEREMYRLGAGNALRDLVAQRGDAADIARSVRGNLAMRDKLATLSPSEDALQRFNGTLDDQSHAFDQALRPDVRGWAMARDALRDQQARATGDQASAIGAAADALDGHLQQIPEMMRADLARQTAQRGQAAFDYGRTVLRGGDAQPWPADLAADFENRPLEQQALLRAGARSDIEQRFGQNRNDLAALARVLGDSNDVNRAHMGTLFGDDATQAMAQALSREQTFANTNNRVVGNSATAGRQGGAAAIDAATKPRQFAIPKDATFTGLIGHAGEAVLRKGMGMLADNAGEQARQQLGQALSLNGPARNRVVQALLQGASTRAGQAQRLGRALMAPATARGATAAYLSDR